MLASTTVAETTTASPRSQPQVQHVVVVGDSIARQIFEAAKVLTPVDIDVTYLISAGPAYAGDWPAPLDGFVPEPESSVMIVSFGTWQATPPPSVADALLSLATEELQAETRAYLEPMTWVGVPNGPALWLRPSVDAAEANALLVQANALIEPIAAELSIRTSFVTNGVQAALTDRPAVVLGTTHYPLRNDDPTHYCPAGALIIAYDALVAEGLEVAAPVESDVDELFARTEGLGLFLAAGCEPLVAG